MTEPAACIKRIRPAPSATARLICFPHAGGLPAAFRAWPAGLGPAVEVWGVIRPGRAGRRHEPLVPSWPPLVEEVARAIASGVEPPFALFGHSLGALHAYEVERLLEREGTPGCHLFVSSCAAPDLQEGLRVPDSDGALIEYVEAVYGAIPPAVRAEPGLLAQFLPVLRADLELLARYGWNPGPPLSCPITAMVGTRDPKVDPAGMRPWSTFTTGGWELLSFPGKHFYLDACAHQVLHAIETRLALACAPS